MNENKYTEKRMMSEEYGTELGGCLVAMMVCALAVIAVGIVGMIILFT